MTTHALRSKLHRLAAWVQRNPLRVWRADHGLSVADLARLLDVTDAAVSSWENGTRSPGLESWQKIVRVAGLGYSDWKQWEAERPV